MNTIEKRCVYGDEERFPARVTATMCLLRRRMRLSREVMDDVVRARGHVTITYGISSVTYVSSILTYFDGHLIRPGNYWHIDGSVCNCYLY